MSAETSNIFFVETPETKVTLAYPSEAAFEAAQDWYNQASKKEIIRHCADRGFSLDSATPGTLLADWAGVAMMVYAWSYQMPPARDMVAGLVAQVRAEDEE